MIRVIVFFVRGIVVGYVVFGGGGRVGVIVNDNIVVVFICVMLVL